MSGKFYCDFLFIGYARYAHFLLMHMLIFSSPTNNIHPIEGASLPVSRTLEIIWRSSQRRGSVRISARSNNRCPECIEAHTWKALCHQCIAMENLNPPRSRIGKYRSA